LSPDFDKNRAVRADCLYFNADGTIKKVVPTLRGVGVVEANNQVQIDRYSAISPQGVLVSFLNPTNKFEGWTISLKGSHTWVRFNNVDFGQDKLKSVNVRAVSVTGGWVEIRLDKLDGPLLAKVKVGKASKWKINQAKLFSVPGRVHDLFVTHNENSAVELDWVSFE
jgi:hypothetical protein